MVIHFCGCWECSKRVAVMIIAVISTLHFLVESVAVVVVGGDHAGVLSQTTPYFYTMIGVQLFMAIISILLWVGACTNIFWFCLPWLFMTFLNLFYHAYILLLLTIKMFTNLDVIKMEMFVFILFSCVVLIYMDGIVGTFVHDLIRNRKSKPKPTASRHNDEEYKPLIRDDYPN